MKESTQTKASVIASGFAMFSMFFGAGNVLYPLLLGANFKNLTLYAVLGFLITAVFVPFLGLISAILFDGNYHKFFERIGKWPGFLLSCFIMALIGPFGATPRTVVIAWSTINQFAPDAVSLALFSFISTIVIFLFSFKKTNILDLIGLFLTPILLLSLAVIIISGLIFATPPPTLDTDPFIVFLEGLKEGYNTMDLLATPFFATVVLIGLKSDMGLDPKAYSKSMIRIALKASLLGGSLLALVYGGFCLISAMHSTILDGVAEQYLIGTISLHLLGPTAGIFACVSVALACLTTAIALCSVFALFIHNDLSNGKIGYLPALLFTLTINFFVATLDFKLIMLYLVPILQIFYPSLIALGIFNILYKVYGFKYVKTPVLLVFLLSLAGSVYSYFG